MLTYFRKLLKVKDHSASAFMRASRGQLEDLASPEVAQGELRDLMRSVAYPDGWFYVERATVIAFWLVGQIDPELDTMNVGVPYVLPLVMQKQARAVAGVAPAGGRAWKLWQDTHCGGVSRKTATISVLRQRMPNTRMGAHPWTKCFTLGKKQLIDGRLRVYYDGYWIKAYEVPADTLLAKKRLIEALTRRLFNHSEHGINVPGRRLEEARRAFDSEGRSGPEARQGRDSGGMPLQPGDGHLHQARRDPGAGRQDRAQ